MPAATDSSRVTVLRLRDAVIADRELPHGAKVIWWLIQTRLVSTAEGIQTGVVTVTIRGFQEVMKVKRNSICEWTKLLRERGYLLIKEGPARHGEFPCNQFFLPPSIPKDTRSGAPKDTRSGAPKDTRSGAPKDTPSGIPTDTLLRDKKRSEEGGGESPPISKAEKAVKTGAGAPEKSNGVPQFAPLPARTFPRELEKMKVAALAKLKEAREEPGNQRRELRKDVADLIADLEEKPRPHSKDRIRELRHAAASWRHAGLTEHGRQVCEAWKWRIHCIEDALLGVITTEKSKP